MATSTSICAIVAPALPLRFKHLEEAFQPNFPALVLAVGTRWLQAPAKLTHHDAISCATPPLQWVSRRGQERRGKGK